MKLAGDEIRSTVCPVLLSVSTYSTGQGMATPTVQGSNDCATAEIMLETVEPTRKDSTGIWKMLASTLRSVCDSRSGTNPITPFSSAWRSASTNDRGVPKGFSMLEKSIHEISLRTS